MAYDLMERVLMDPRLRAGPRMVLVVLAQHADLAKKQCYPGVRRIMRMTGMGERTVLRNIEKLREGGYVETAKGRSKARTTLYTLLPAKWPKPANATCQEVQTTPVESGGSDLTDCKHNQEGDTEEGSGKTKSKTKTCDGSQEKQVNNLSKSLGKSDKGIQVQQKNDQESKTDIAKKKIDTNIKTEIKKKTNVDTSSVAKLAPLPLPPIGTSKLAELWIEHASKQDVTACLTAKDGRMLRDAAKKINYGNMLKVIPLVIEEWKGFTDFCYYQGTAYTIPKMPQVAFFVKFLDKAYEFLKRRQRKVELKQKQEDMTTQLLQLQARTKEMAQTAFAVIDEPLPMTQKCEVLQLAPKHVAKWEKVFGPVTVDCLQPEFAFPGFLYYFHEDPTIKLPKATDNDVTNFKKYLAEVRGDRIWAEIQMDPAYEKLARQIEHVEDRIKDVSVSLKGL